MSLILKPRWQSLIAAALAVIVCGPSALADDSEIFTGGSSSDEVACQRDYSSTAPIPTTYNGPNNTAASEWVNTANAANSYWAQSGASGGGYTLYSANYLNHLASNPPTVSGTRISVVQQAATNLINSLSNVNIGLMRYSNNLSGPVGPADPGNTWEDRKSTRLNSSHLGISYAVFCL